MTQRNVENNGKKEEDNKTKMMRFNIDADDNAAGINVLQESGGSMASDKITRLEIQNDKKQHAKPAASVMGTRCWRRGLHEELRSVGVLATIGHRQKEWLLVLHLEGLIWKRKMGESAIGHIDVSSLWLRSKCAQRRPLTIECTAVD